MSATDSFAISLGNAASRIEGFLSTTLPASDTIIAKAMRYSVLNGGKRLRAFLVYESAALHDIPLNTADPVAASIECLHAYSLVHDDLPCMDDDDLRRGKATVHIKWDEATAVLTGDALQTQAFTYLAATPTLIAPLADAAGVNGMVGGQALDIAAETAALPLTLAQITALQALKTGALIRWSCVSGALLASVDPAPLHTYAEAVGLAFQIRDDILDIVGDAKTAGKRLRKDERAGKATFVSHLGLGGAKSRAVELVDIACAALDPYGARAENLRNAAKYIITRAT
ncbi:MAG: polyprenyl synthetase family protein [Paracoccaceae bacterium]